MIFFTCLTSYVISDVGFKLPASLLIGLQKAPTYKWIKHSLQIEDFQTAIALEEGAVDLFLPGLVWVTLRSLADHFDPCFLHI